MISAVILTKNEEKNILDCIESVLFCDEILIIDDNSTDKTVDFVEKLQNPKIHLLTHTLEDFASQRNFALSKAQGDWVLFVDADERVSDPLASEISSIQFPLSNDVQGFYIKREDIVWEKKLEYGEVGNMKLLRFGRKDAGIWEGKVHEVWKIKGKTGTLVHTLTHYPHTSVTEFLSKINSYSTLRAQELYTKKKKTNWFWILAYPKAKFIKNYIFLKGYKDGTAGFVHAVLMSFHSFLVRGKLYLLWKGIKNT